MVCHWIEVYDWYDRKCYQIDTVAERYVYISNGRPHSALVWWISIIILIQGFHNIIMDVKSLDNQIMGITFKYCFYLRLLFSTIYTIII